MRWTIKFIFYILFHFHSSSPLCALVIVVAIRFFFFLLFAQDSSGYSQELAYFGPSLAAVGRFQRLSQAMPLHTNTNSQPQLTVRIIARNRREPRRGRYNGRENKSKPAKTQFYKWCKSILWLRRGYWQQLENAVSSERIVVGCLRDVRGHQTKIRLQKKRLSTSKLLTASIWFWGATDSHPLCVYACVDQPTEQNTRTHSEREKQ